MASISITIRKFDGASESTIMVSGDVSDASLEPVTTQIASLLGNTVSSAISTPTPAPAAV